MKSRQFDFTDLANFAKGVPYGELRQLRHSTPVYWNPTPTPAMPQNGFWLITKHSDILHIEENPVLFSSHFGLTLADSPELTAGPPWSMVRDGLAHLDSPEHPAHRQIIAPSFTPRTITAMEDRIRLIAKDVINKNCELREFDFASEVALRFSVSVVLGEVLGLPASDFERVVNWNEVIFAPEDPKFSPVDSSKAVHDIYQYALLTLAMRRKEPKDDVLSLLAHTKMADGNFMSDEMFIRYFWSLLTGAFDTTASAISGGMLAFIKHPIQYERLLLYPSLLVTAVEEILRWETPITYFRRTVMDDTELRGYKIRQGQRIAMCYASANRDEEEFVNSENFDITRKSNNHLSFGHGRHYCLGAYLARAEIRILFEQIIQRKLRVELQGEPKRALSNFQNRIKYMPVYISYQKS